MVKSVLTRQRRPLLVACLLAAAGLWIAIPTGKAEAGIFFGIGIFLGLLNHILTEVGLARNLETGDQLSRKQFAMGSFGRLMIVTVIAFGLAIPFWPNGIAVFVGLALMHLIVIVFTGLPLLNEMKKA